jgi:hypothetical protein
MKPKIALAPFAVELRQAKAETARRAALKKQRSRLAEKRHPER